MELFGVGLVSLFAGIIVLIVFNLVLSPTERIIQKWGFRIGLTLMLVGLTVAVLTT